MLLPTIRQECAQFLRESNNLPLLKNLSRDNEGFKKVKARRRNAHEIFVEAFNASFSTHKNLFQRAVVANGEASFTPSADSKLEPFYIFPIDGYRFLYNPVVNNSIKQYNEDIEKMLHTVSDKSVAIDMFSAVIKNSYISKDLPNGIRIGAEIIIYDIPYFYAIRKSLIDDYSELS
jgi:hypothetical protein